MNLEPEKEKLWLLLKTVPVPEARIIWNKAMNRIQQLEAQKEEPEKIFELFRNYVLKIENKKDQKNAK